MSMKDNAEVPNTMSAKATFDNNASNINFSY